MQNKKLLRKLDKRIFDEIGADIDKGFEMDKELIISYMTIGECFRIYYNSYGRICPTSYIESLLEKYCNTCEKPKADDKSKE